MGKRWCSFDEQVALLAERGVRTAVIKSDSHGFQLDTEGKDTARFSAAGAEAVAVSAPDGYFILQKTRERQDFQDIIEKLDDVDLYITESRSRGVLPTLILDRGLAAPEIDERTAALFAKEKSAQDTEEILCCDLDDPETAAQITLFLMGRPLYGADGIMFLTM